MTRISSRTTTTLRLAAASLLLAVVAASPARGDDAKAIYQKKCASCHGEQGKGDGPAAKKLQPAPGDFATALKGKDDDYITKSIRDGGAAIGKSKLMPAYKALKDDELAGLVKYVKGLAGQ